MLMTGNKFDSMESFETVVKEGLEKRIPGAKRISFQSVVKNNDRRLRGCVIERQDSNVSPTIYIDDMYRDIQEGTLGVDEAIDRMAEAFRAHSDCPRFDVKGFTEWERAKEKIVMRLVSRERNKELLQDAPSTTVAGIDDLAIVYTYLMEVEPEGQGSIMIKNAHMQEWGVDIKDLQAVAEQNSPRLLPATVQSMEEVLGSVGITAPDMGVGMTVITNSSKTYGAAVILYKELLKDLAARMNTEELILIPSSVHEMLAISGSNTHIDDVNEMIREVNESQVAPGDQLGDHAYRYTAATDSISMQ